MSHKSAYGRFLATQKLRAELDAAPRRFQIVRDEACVHCGESSERSHPGGVASGRWKCHCCRPPRWQPSADPQEPKVLQPEEARS